MSAGREKFKEQIEALGYKTELSGAEGVVVPFAVVEGRFAGQSIKVGFQVPADFEMTPPGGIHISPRLIPLNPGAPDHARAATSDLFGDQGEYLSRPFTEWPLKRTVKRYMEYVSYLLNTL